MKSTFRKSMAGLLVVVVLAALVVLAGCSSSSSSANASASASSSEALQANDVQMSHEPAVYDEPFYVLVVGNDTRTGTIGISEEVYADGNARSDTFMLVRIDPVNYKLAILTIPRDTQAYFDGAKHKINEAYQYHGIEGAVQQAEELTGVKCRYYLNMTFVQFENFVNELGGITVNVPVDMSLQDIVNGDQINLSAGEQKLDGAEALVFARTRKIFQVDQDAVRQIHDRALVEAGIRYVAYNPSVAKLAVAAVVANSENNWDEEDLLSLVERFCNHSGQLEIVSGTGPYDGDVDGDTGLWMAYRDEDTWHHIIEVVENGGSPTDVVALPDMILK